MKMPKTKWELFEAIREYDDEFSPLMARGYTVKELKEILTLLKQDQEDRENQH